MHKKNNFIPSFLHEILNMKESCNFICDDIK